MARGKNTTALVPTGGGSNSLRTTVPMWIVEQFGLSAGSKLEWKLSAENGQMSIHVTPVEV
tara:strand:+ start:367 stop:549 length:183 start_codon:yes stop_codon:yes gene_type:complete